jgi:hypothetical protein
MAGNLKVKILASLIILLIIAGQLLTRSKSETPPVQTEEYLSISTKEDSKKIAPSIDEKIPAKSPTTAHTQVVKKIDTPTDEANARETELEFLQMNIPASLSSIKEVRYQEVYSIYQKSSFYLSEIAADRLETNKENLSKAFKGLILYFSEGNVMDQMDSALVIIQQENPGLFDEAMSELSKKDRLIIEKLLDMQNESE